MPEDDADNEVETPVEASRPVDPPMTPPPPDPRYAAEERRERRVGRLVVVLVGLVLVPVAAGIGGFCCCLASLGTSVANIETAFSLGLLLGAALAIAFLFSWWDRLG